MWVIKYSSAVDKEKYIKEAKKFMNAKTIDSTKTTWLELYKLKQEIGTR